MSKLDDIFDTNTVALTKYIEEQTTNPDLPSLLEIADFDTRVINTYETKKQIKALMLELVTELETDDIWIDSLLLRKAIEDL